jgi:hypothetical protein
MHRHPFFDLMLHDGAELSDAMGAPVTARATLAEWPLSCVERIATAGGRAYIYKVQAQPTVEPEFYARARSPLLVAARQLPCPSGPDALLLDAVAGQALNAPDQVDALLEQIGAIEGDLPALADLRIAAGREAVFSQIVDDLRALTASGVFRLTTPGAAGWVERAAVAPSVRAALAGAGPQGYVHMDLRRENILSTSEGCRVIDWQRPIYGPTALDRATLLESFGLDPLPHVGRGIVTLLTLLRVGWLAACARRWFPPGAPDYDRQIALLLPTLSTSVSNNS